MADIFVMDGRDERLKSFGIDGIFTATCCPNCVGFLKGPAFSRFSLDGSSEAMASELFDGSKSTSRVERDASPRSSPSQNRTCPI